MIKEVASYEKEVITNEARVQKMRDDGKDPYGMFWLVEGVIYHSLQISRSRKKSCRRAT